jgi:hypothetical protein
MTSRARENKEQISDGGFLGYSQALRWWIWCRADRYGVVGALVYEFAPVDTMIPFLDLPIEQFKRYIIILKLKYISANLKVFSSHFYFCCLH